MKNFSHTVGNRTRDLPASSALPQRTASLPPNDGGRDSELEKVLEEMLEAELQVKLWHLPRWIERNHATFPDVCGSKCELSSLQMQMSNANHLSTMFANTC